MTLYRVRWEIDIEAETPLSAARKALDIQLNPDSIANVFEVAPHSNPNDFETIDLSYEEDPE